MNTVAEAIRKVTLAMQRAINSSLLHHRTLPCPVENSRKLPSTRPLGQPVDSRRPPPGSVIDRNYKGQ